MAKTRICSNHALDEEEAIDARYGNDAAAAAGDGVNALDKKHPVERFHAGIAGLSPLRRGKHWHANAEIWGVMLDEGFDPRALMDSQPIKFTKSMEGALSRDQ